MRIYLVRHGKTNYNKKGLMQGRINESYLNKDGINDALELRKKLSDKNIDICYSSPLFRTYQTAFFIVWDRCEIIRDYRLIERSLGELEGKPRWEYSMEEYWNVNINSSNKNVEPINDLYNRVENFLFYIQKNILIKIF